MQAVFLLWSLLLSSGEVRSRTAHGGDVRETLPLEEHEAAAPGFAHSSNGHEWPSEPESLEHSSLFVAAPKLHVTSEASLF